MKTLLMPPDSHHLSAAVGWLELGNPSEAKEELKRVAAEFQDHPEVMAVRWGIHYRAKEYEACMAVAERFTAVDPENVQSWVDLSISHYKLGRTQEAYETLAKRLQKFPAEWAFYYNLACYAVQLGHLAEGKDWLDRAMVFGNEKDVKEIALEDPDLEPIWDKIRS